MEGCCRCAERKWKRRSSVAIIPSILSSYTGQSQDWESVSDAGKQADIWTRQVHKYSVRSLSVSWERGREKQREKNREGGEERHRHTSGEFQRNLAYIQRRLHGDIQLVLKATTEKAEMTTLRKVQPIIWPPGAWLGHVGERIPTRSLTIWVVV